MNLIYLTFIFYLAPVFCIYGQSTVTVDFKINLTTCFAPQQVDWFSGELTHLNDTINILNEEGLSSAELTPSRVYKLEINPFFNNEIYTTYIQLGYHDSLITLNSCIGQEIPLNELQIHENRARKDINNGHYTIFLYPNLKFELIDIAHKYGYSIEWLNKVAEKYDFSFKYTGCQMNENNRQGFYRYNEYIMNRISSKYSNDWVRDFEQELIKELISQKPWYKRFYFRINKKKLLCNLLLNSTI